MASQLQNMLSSQASDQLQELIQLNLDARDGYRETAQQLEDPAMRREFLFVADQHSTQAAELQRYGLSSAEQPIINGPFLAAWHRSWANVRAALWASDVYAILREVEQSEDHIEAAYEAALRTKWDEASLRTAIETQRAATKSQHDRMRTLRDANKPRF